MQARRIYPPWKMETPASGEISDAYEKSLLVHLGEPYEGCVNEWCLEEGFRYARENRQGKWPGFEDFLQEVAEETGDHSLLVQYAVKVTRGRSPSLEETLFHKKKCFRDLGYYMESDPIADHRDEVEAHLVDCAMKSETVMRNTVWYSTKFKAGSFHKVLEDAILQGRCKPMSAVEFVICTNRGKWSPLEGVLLGSPATRELVLALIRYTAVCVGTRWDPAERYILAIPNQPRRRNAIVWYARDVAKDRWEEAEDELAMSPRHLYGYAKEAMKGRLPEGLHEKMVKHGVFGDRFGKRYVERYCTTHGGGG